MHDDTLSKRITDLFRNGNKNSTIRRDTNTTTKHFRG